MDNQAITIDVVIPVYNEKDNIEANLDALYDYIKGIEEIKSITIIYDFDEDNTLPVVNAIKDKYGDILRLDRNPGRGALNAIKHGILSSDCDYVLISMADLSDDYSKIQPIVDSAKQGADIVCASRYMPGGKLHGGPFIKQLMSRLSGTSLHWLAGIPTHDITNSFKLYKTEAVRQLAIESKGGFEIGMEITAKFFVSGRKIEEVPAHWWDRSGGESKFRLIKWLPNYLKWYFYLLKYTFSKL